MRIVPYEFTDVSTEVDVEVCFPDGSLAWGAITERGTFRRFGRTAEEVLDLDAIVAPADLGPHEARAIERAQARGEGPIVALLFGRVVIGGQEGARA